MSQKWAFKETDTLAEHVNTELRHQIHNRKLLFYLSHDNVNIQFCIYEQWVDQQSHFDSGMVTTIYLMPDSEEKPLNNQGLQEQRKIGQMNPVTAKDVVGMTMPAAKHVTLWMRHWILQFLLDSPDFDLKNYNGQSNAWLKPPLPVCELHWGQGVNSPVGPC